MQHNANILLHNGEHRKTFSFGKDSVCRLNFANFTIIIIVKMDSTRQLKVSRLIQKELGEIFQRETRLLFGNALITVTQVRVSPDLGIAKVYVSLFNVPDNKALLKLIQENTKEIRMKLSERIKKQVRIIPNLVFFHDDSLDYAMRIDELLKK